MKNIIDYVTKRKQHVLLFSKNFVFSLLKLKLSNFQKEFIRYSNIQMLEIGFLYLDVCHCVVFYLKTKTLQIFEIN